MDYQRTPFTPTTRTAESAAGVRVQGHETTPRSVPSRPHAGTARRAWVDGDVGDRHVAGPRAIRTSDHATGGPPLGGLFDDAEEVDATAGLADRLACIAPSPCKNSQDHVDNAHENTDRQGDEEADDEEADDEEADDEETGGAVTLTWAMVESMERQRLQQETKQQQQSPQSQTGGDAVGFRMLVMSDEEDLAVTWHYSSSEDDEGVSTRSPPKNDKQSPASTYYDVKSILSPTNASHAKASTSGSATSASVSRSAWSLYGTQVSMGSLRSLRRLSSQSLSYSVNVLASASPTTPQGHGHVAHNAAPYHVGHGHSPVVPDNRPTVVDDASLRYTEWPASLPTAIPAPGKAYLSTAAAAGVTAIAPRKEAQRAVEGLIPDTLSSLGASHPLKILLVDDNHGTSARDLSCIKPCVVVQMTMVKTLSKLGYACDVANNGQEVMALITRPTLYEYGASQPQIWLYSSNDLIPLV